MSSDRKGRYMKPGTKSSAPGVIIACHCHTATADGQCARGVRERRFASGTVAVCCWNKHKWGKIHEYQTTTAEATRELIWSLGIERRLNWVVCPIASDVLSLTQWWEYAERMGVRWEGQSGGEQRPEIPGGDRSGVVVRRLVARGTPDIIEYTDRCKSFRWVSLSQYLASEVTDLAIANDSQDVCEQRSDSDADVEHGKRRAGAARICTRFCALCDWWRRTAKAPFGMTVGQLALGMLRSYVQPKTLCTHSHELAHPLERSAAHGGRASVWYVGNIGDGTGHESLVTDAEGCYFNRRIDSTLVHLDVRSMYPSLLASQTFPVKLLEYREDVTPQQAVELSTAFGVIARVRLRTQRAEYPYRREGSVIYPVGEFTTTLCGPELQQVHRDGEILEVYAISIYKLGRPFEGFTELVLRERARMRQASDFQGEAFMKHLANSLAGKLAQRQGGWKRTPEHDTPHEWGEQHALDLDTGKTVRTRYVAGFAWQWDDDKDGRGPYTFAFAYLTSYGRCMMRGIRERLHPDTVVSQDTDGLWVFDTCENRPILDQISDDAEPGQLRKMGSVRNARFFSPRHYYAGGKWVLAGFHNPKIDPETLTIEDTWNNALWGSRTQSAPSGTTELLRSSRLGLGEVGGQVHSSGYVEPFYVGG